MPQKMTEAENERIHQQLNASFTLAGYLLEAQDESAAILAAMRIGHDLLKATGCAFVPFNEWKQSVPVLKYGQADFLQNGDWQAHLSGPATRHACRSCVTKQAGAECILLQEPADAQNVYCVSLRCGGREIGIVSYFFSAPPHICDDQRLFLAEMVRLTDLALDALRVNEQEVEATRRALTPMDLKKKLDTLDARNKELLGQLE